MRATRRYWSSVRVGVVLTALAVLASRPAILVGAAAIGAWLIAAQYLAAERMAAMPDEHAVRLSAESPRVAVDRPVRVSLSVDRRAPTRETLEVTAPVPVAARGPDAEARTVHLDPSETGAATAFEVSFPVAGEYDLPEPRLTVRDWTGQFEETVELGETDALTVESNEPDDVHVGQGGDRVTSVYGEHSSDQTGSGLVPAEIRQYEPGDALSKIDWKATARFDHPYVREFETETNRRASLVFDHRAAMGLGAAGVTMLDYAREVGLWFSRVVQEHGDPLGLYTVGDEGPTAERRPVATTDRYREVRTRLRSLAPTEHASAPEREDGRRPSRTRTLARRLEGEGDPFAATLRPFLSSADTYVHRVSGDPLYETVRRHQAQTTGDAWTALVTDDSRREETFEAVRLAATKGNRVLVFLTPRVLFEEDSLADLRDAYHRYVEFEEFRRRLDGLAGVSAFEVAPGERLRSVVDSRERGRERSAARRRDRSSDGAGL